MSADGWAWETLRRPPIHSFAFHFPSTRRPWDNHTLNKAVIRKQRKRTRTETHAQSVLQTSDPSPVALILSPLEQVYHDQLIFRSPLLS